MYVGIGGSKGYEVVTIREDSHIPGTKKKRIKAQIREDTIALKEARKPITLLFPNDTISVPSVVTASYSFVHAIVSKMWQLLGLDVFLKKEST